VWTWLLSVCVVGASAVIPSGRCAKEPILGLAEFNDNELVAVDPARDNHQQKREQRRRRARAASLPQASAE
jgi:hypothetical protein